MEKKETTKGKKGTLKALTGYCSASHTQEERDK
jgi:hypothetical protein